MKHEGMVKGKRRLRLIAILNITWFLFTPFVWAYDVNEKLSIEAVLAAGYQYQDLSETSAAENGGRGAVPFQPEVNITPTEVDEIFFKLGFAAGNGLNAISPFVLEPWAADLEDDVKDINGRNRDYLLTAGYEHTFQFSESHSLEMTGGIIDSTDYIDENTYSNDEYTQFMNEALVNGPNGFAPSYDIGGAFEWEVDRFVLNGVVMNVGENKDGNNYNFFAAQLGYTLETGLGEGNYRLIHEGTSKDFLDPTGTKKESRHAVFLSFDQDFGDILGAWIRFGTQDDDASVAYKNLYSGGINISGKLWGREVDNIGIAYGYLYGGNQDIDNTHVAEAYVRFALHEYVALTLDMQYMRDKYEIDDEIKGFIYGLRAVAEF